jgi:hypothetical protein
VHGDVLITLYKAADSTAKNFIFAFKYVFFMTKGPLTSPDSQRGPLDKIKVKTSTLMKFFPGPYKVTAIGATIRTTRYLHCVGGMQIMVTLKL